MASLNPPETIPDWDADKLVGPTFERKLPPSSSMPSFPEDDLAGSKQGKKFNKDKGGIFGNMKKK